MGKNLKKLCEVVGHQWKALPNMDVGIRSSGSGGPYKWMSLCKCNVCGIDSYIPKNELDGAKSGE